MLFKRIKLNNIRSYEDAEVTFPSGSVLLSGDIGSGKTSILIAIEFALFGLQPGQKGASLLKNGKDEGFVELEFEVDNEEICVKRILKRKKTVSQDSAYLTINGHTEEKSTTEIKNFILQKINYPLEFAKKTNLLYRFTVYTPQENMKQIIIEEPETRLNTLRHVFGIDKYKRIKENTDILSLHLRETSRMKQGQIADLETIKQILEDKKLSLEKIRQEIPILENNLLEVIERKKQKEKEIIEVREKIDEKNKLQHEVEKTNIMLANKNEQISKFEREISQIKSKIEQTSKTFDKEEFNELLKQIESKKSFKESINKEIQIISNSMSALMLKKKDLELLKTKISSLKTCPTCLQEVSSVHKHSILSKAEEEINSINKEKISHDNKKQEKEISFEQLNSEIESLDRKKSLLHELKIRMENLDEDKSRHSAMEKQKIILEKDVIILYDQISTLKEHISNLKKFDSIMESKQSEINNILFEEKKLEIKRAETIKEIDLTEKDIALKKEGINAKEKIKTELIHLNELEAWLSGQFLEMISFIEKNVMLQLKDEFSRLFNEWFSILVPDTFSVKLDDTFTPVIEQQGFELDYNFLSGGERTAIALSYRLALNQTLNSLLSEIKTKGIVILDEPTEGFSQQQLDKMRDVLNELSVNQLIIVSHDQKIESFVDNIIKLNKSQTGTKIID